MPFIAGPLGALLIAAVLVLAVAVWLGRRRRDYPGPRLHGEDGIDREELEAAEREVRDLERPAPGEDELPGDDWGPGAARPRPPVRL